MGVTLGPSSPEVLEVNWTRLGPEAMVEGMVVVRFCVALVWLMGCGLRGLWASASGVVSRRSVKRKFGQKHTMFVLSAFWVHVALRTDFVGPGRFSLCYESGALVREVQ